MHNEQLTGANFLFNFNGMFGKRNNNRVILLSLLGVGIGTLAIWLIRGTGNKIASPTMQTMKSRSQMKNGLSNQ
ncbi:hypothetical protein G3M54_00545 [Bacillus megaterium NBRC 15308 = ATCC 14581]|nr:hypothetical protein [Priestia megaterium NBRC 15308 = ATCC 14581]